MRFKENDQLDVALYEEHARNYVLKTNYQRSLLITRAEGVRFWDQHGRSYLDFMSKAVCVSLGFGRREITEALHQQLELGSFSAPWELNPRQVELAEVMAGIAPGPLKRSAFYGSGSEAIEAALKIARRATGRSKVISHWGGYHGTTEGALAAGGAGTYKGDYGPQSGSYIHIPPPDTLRGTPSQFYIDLLQAAVEYESPWQVAAILVEPLLAGGVLELPPDYLASLRKLADEHGIVLIFDEVITGFGRTGTMFYCEQTSISPDVLVTGKGMSSSYVPCSATTVTEELASSLGVLEEEGFDRYLSKGQHLVTSQNHPLACASALATIAYIRDKDLLPQVRASGQRLLEGLEQLAGDYEQLARPRGAGLLAGVEVVCPENPMTGDADLASRIGEEAANRGLIVAVNRDRLPRSAMLLAAPPLTVTGAEIDEALDILRHSIEAACGLEGATSAR